MKFRPYNRDDLISVDLISGTYCTSTFLSLSDEPEIEVEAEKVHSGLGKEAHLTCIVHGEPRPLVSSLFGLVHKCKFEFVRVFCALFYPLNRSQIYIHMSGAQDRIPCKSKHYFEDRDFSHVDFPFKLERREVTTTSGLGSIRCTVLILDLLFTSLHFHYEMESYF